MKRKHGVLIVMLALSLLLVACGRSKPPRGGVKPPPGKENTEAPAADLSSLDKAKTKDEAKNIANAVILDGPEQVERPEGIPISADEFVTRYMIMKNPEVESVEDCPSYMTPWYGLFTIRNTSEYDIKDFYFSVVFPRGTWSQSGADLLKAGEQMTSGFYPDAQDEDISLGFLSYTVEIDGEDVTFSYDFDTGEYKKAEDDEY